MSRTNKPKSKQTLSEQFDEILRHPLLLLLVGSIHHHGLSGELVHPQMDEQQKQREATVKTFDSLRSALDDLTISLGSVHILTSGPKAQASEAKAR